MTVVKRIISVLLLCVIVLSLGACFKTKTAEEAIESANALVEKWNSEALGACSYEAEAKRENGKDVTYWVYARFASAVKASEQADMVRAMAIQDIFKNGYPKLEEEFENLDVNVIILVMDDKTLYCGIEDGEINYMDD